MQRGKLHLLQRQKEALIVGSETLVSNVARTTLLKFSLCVAVIQM